MRRLDLTALGIDALQVGDKIMREFEFRLRDRRFSNDVLDDLDRLAGPSTACEPAGDELAQHGVQPAHRLGA